MYIRNQSSKQQGGYQIFERKSLVEALISLIAIINLRAGGQINNPKCCFFFLIVEVQHTNTK
jgi:hypothetical protein